MSEREETMVVESPEPAPAGARDTEGGAALQAVPDALAERDPLPPPEEKVDRLAGHVRGLLVELGLDLDDPNMRDTDRRVARLYLEMFAGLELGAEPKVTTFPNDEGYSHMVMEKKIPFYSMCAHHLVPFYGHAHMAYIPRERILGLSKFARILEFYAKRPQLQERLTEQVVNFLEEALQPLGAMVVIEARHLCVEMRGVKKPGVVTTTSALRGIFHQRPVREEFLDLLRHS
jgi:GTP cyclohydrolase IA